MKEPLVIDFPVPYYGQDEQHKDMYPQLKRWYEKLTKKHAPEKYSPENYLKLFEAVEKANI